MKQTVTISLVAISQLIGCKNETTTPIPSEPAWTQVTDYVDGSVYSLVNDTILFAGTQWGGIYRSTDWGLTWFKSNSELRSLAVYSLAENVDASGKTTLIAGTNSGGLFQSTDLGDRWTHASLGYPFIRCIRVLGFKIFVGTALGGLYTSSNNGTDWIRNSLEVPSVIFDIAFVGSKIFVASDGGISSSIDNGASWVNADSGITHSDVDVRSLLVVGASIFAATYGDGVFKSSNLGTNWFAANAGLTRQFTTALTICESTVLVGTVDSGAYYSINDGSTWTHIDSEFKNKDVWSLAVDGPRVLAGTEIGIFESTDNGRAWTSLLRGR